jgi:hypothetical protein
MVKDNSMCLCLRSSSLEPKKLLVFSINGVMCYFPPLVVLQGIVIMFGKNVKKTKVEIRAGVKILSSKAFQKFHITIGFCMKLEDVLEVLPMLMPKSFLDWFIFIWGHELKGFEMCLLCLLWERLWKGGANMETFIEINIVTILTI